MEGVVCEVCNTTDENGVQITAMAHPEKEGAEAYRTVGLCCIHAALALKSFVEHWTVDSLEAGKIFDHIGDGQ